MAVWISYPYVNVDICDNDIFDTSDDGVEADTGRAAVRIWDNRIHNAVPNGISFQPQAGGPWYIISNEIAGNKQAAFKFRTTDRFVLLHNTIVNWGTVWPGTSMMCCNEDHLLRAYARNKPVGLGAGRPDLGFDAGIRDWRTDRPGEWLKYSVSVASAGAYTLDMRVASVGTGARFHMEIDGVDATGAIRGAEHGRRQVCQTVTKTGLPLITGAHVVRLVFDAGTSENDGCGNSTGCD